MGDHNKLISRPIFRRDMRWDPFPNWTQPPRFGDQDYGLPPFLEPSDIDWIDWAKRRLTSYSWPGFTHSPLLPVFHGHHPAELHERLHKRHGVGVSEVRTGQDSWKINLDVNHFSPEEISITTKEGYLQIEGNHEERQDEQGLISRCFTRKYRLPDGVDLQHISSSLLNGVLSIEAPAAGIAAGTNVNEVVIPVQIRQEKDAAK